MKILMLSWEYPPKVIGGLARAVADISESLVENGHEVTVVTSDHPECEPIEYVSGVRVHRVNQHYPAPLGFIDSVLYMNNHFTQKVFQLVHEKSFDFDVIHAHDWLVAPSAKVLKHALQKPLIATIHATEWGRNNGIHNELQRHISDVEWWLTYEAYRVICCSYYMHAELKRVFHLPEDKIAVIPNGVHLENFVETHSDLNSFRNQWALPEEKIVFYVGRHVHEKGLDLLLEAAPKILSSQPLTKFVIAGKGPVHDDLKQKAWAMGLGEKVLFAGFIDDKARNSLYRLADVAVFPSRYEPFGIVALEAMAAGAPLVVSDIGGFGEIVRHGENGLTFYAGNSNSLADNILTLLHDKQFANSLQKTAYAEVIDKYDWENIALQTVEEYQKVVVRQAPQGQSQIRKVHHEIYERYQTTNDLPGKGAEFYESSDNGRR